jgi:CysZ protein
MGFFYGLWCHIEALKIFRQKKSLIFWASLRFITLIVLFVILSAIAISNNREVLQLLWLKPQNYFLVILWYLLLFITSIILMFAAGIISYIISQILFGVLIADHMSILTESIVTGKITNPQMSLGHLIFLIKQEIPRTFIPLITTSAIMVFGWILPLGVVLVVASVLLSCLFTAWDYTDLVPARALYSFKERFGMFKKDILGHLGFGLPFAVPFLNVLLFSMGPVSGTLFYLRKHKDGASKTTQDLDSLSQPNG